MATPVRVELAAGEVVLRQLPGSGILLSQEPTQTIVPLGKLILLGYTVQWDGDGFLLRAPGGNEIETMLEGECPTVSEECAVSLCVNQSEGYKFYEEKR